MDKSSILICIALLIGLILTGIGGLFAYSGYLGIVPGGGGRYLSNSPMTIVMNIGEFLVFCSFLALVVRYFTQKESD
jgi:hypothetical protein